MLLVLSACSPGPEPRDADDSAPASQTGDGLSPSLQVKVSGQQVQLDLFVTNSGSQAVTLEFPSAQRYDFAIRAADGAEVWRWSADRMFGQAIGSETVGAGETLHLRATWEHGGRRGRFTASGRLTSTSHPIEQHAAFELQ